MQQRFFLYNQDEDEFVEVPDWQPTLILGGVIRESKNSPEWFNGNYIRAFCEGVPGDTDFWRYDLHLSGAFGCEILAMLKVVKLVQGDFDVSRL